MKRAMKTGLLALACMGVVSMSQPAFADGTGKAITGVSKSGTKVVVKAKPAPVAVKAAPAKRFAPYKTYGFKTGPKGKFHHHHPIPSGGWCRIDGWHWHTYAPVANPHWVVDTGGWVYLGVVPTVVVAPAPPPPPRPAPVIVVAPAPAPPPPPVRVIWVDGPDCKEKYEVKKDGIKYEYKCKHKKHGKHKKHHDHDD